jgi:GNAT superfamily N-acetyltransferase
MEIDGRGAHAGRRRDAEAVPARTGFGVEVRPPADAWEWRQASGLLHDFAEWVHVVAGVDLGEAQPAIGRELDDLASVYGADDADMFMALDEGLAVGIVAVRYHGDRSAELKRMYVRPVARGKGIADRLALRIVAAAASRECSDVWLETLPGPMDPAIAVYRRCGFVEARRRGTLDRTDTIVMDRTIDDGGTQP